MFGLEVSEVPFVVLVLLLPIVCIGVVIFALYWVIRKAVRDGIRDSRIGKEAGATGSPTGDAG